MSTPVKIGVFILSVLVGLAIALTVLVKTQLTPEKVRETLLPLVEKSLQRKVDFGEIKVGLFSGISVADLQVMEKDADGQFFAVKSVELHYQFWPLLAGNVVINQVLLDHPQIYCTRMADGKFNFSDLLPESAAGKKNPASTGESTGQSARLSAAFGLLVKEVDIKDGELQFVDRFKNDRSPFRYTLNELNFKARQITFDKPFPLDLSAVINGSHIDISGHYDFSQHMGDMTIHLAPLDVLQFAPYYRTTIPGKLGSAQLALNLEVELLPEKISSKGNLTLDDVDLLLDSFPSAGLKQASLGVDYALDYSIDTQQLAISTLLLHFNGIDLEADGEVDLSASEPFLVFTLLFRQLDLREVMQKLPIKLSQDYQKYSFAGLVDGRIDLAGKASYGIDLLKSVHLSLSDVRASAENLRAGLSGDISYADHILQSDNLLLQYGDQQANLQLNVKKSADNLFRGKFSLTAETLDLNKLAPDSAKNADSSQGSGVEQSKASVEDIGPFDLPVAMEGTLAINHLLYKQLEMEKVTADLSLKNNYLSIRHLNSKIGGGELKASTDINLAVKGLTYNGQMVLAQPNVVALVSGLFPETGQTVSGLLQVENKFSGRGTIPKKLLRVLQLKGEFSLQNGQVKGSPLMEGLATFLGDSDFRVLSFKSLTGQYDLHDGVTHLSSHLDSSRTKLSPVGTIDVDGRLNLRLDARFAPEVINKLGVSKKLKQNLSGADGWGRLPLQIQGTLTQPKIAYDSVALKNQALEKAKEKVTGKLLEKLAPGSGGETEPIKQMLDNTLNKLFGK